MKWLLKLFIPKHEHYILDMIDNAVTLTSNYNRQYKFLDSNGNGLAFDSWENSVTFIVDEQRVDEWGSHKISYNLSKYADGVYHAHERMKEADRQKKRWEEDRSKFHEALSSFQGKIKKD